MRLFFRLLFRLTRRAVLALLVVGLVLISNTLLLTSDALYDGTKRGLWRVASLVTDIAQPRTHRANTQAVERLSQQIETLEADRRRLDANLRTARHRIVELGADNETLERRTARLARERTELDRSLSRARKSLTELARENAALADERSKLARLIGDMDASTAATRQTTRSTTTAAIGTLDGTALESVGEINDRMARRTARMISANLSFMAAEAVPYLGAGVITAVTYMEVHDACKNLADTREIALLLAGETTSDVPACGYSPQEFWDILHCGTDTQTCRELSANMPDELRIDCLAILRPGETTDDEATDSTVMEISRPGE